MKYSEQLLCKQANQIDLVDWLATLGHRPENTRGNDYWYLSPLRKETTASFKVNRRLNLWYDHGTGIGGTLVDFGIAYFNCTVKELLPRLQPSQIIDVSFQPQFSKPAVEKKEGEAPSQRVIIISAGPIQNPTLINYLRERKIEPAIAAKFCREVCFEITSKTRLAIGFRNGSGGYELRSRDFKGSSAPKEPTMIRQEDPSKLAVFEGFFDFLSFQMLTKYSKDNQMQLPFKQIDFLILNSLAFFETQRKIMEQYDGVHLFLDRDKQGLKMTGEALRWSDKYKDNSHFYDQYKDLNEWLVKAEGLQIKQRQSRGLHL